MVTNPESDSANPALLKTANLAITTPTTARNANFLELFLTNLAFLPAPRNYSTETNKAIALNALPDVTLALKTDVFHA